MNKILSIIIISLALFVFAACTTPQAEPASGDTITGIVWKWQTVTDKSSGSSTKVPNPDNYTIIFQEDGTTEGQADCKEPIRRRAASRSLCSRT